MTQYQLAADLKGHSDRVWCVAWSPDGQSLASCSGDKTVRIWACPEATKQKGNDPDSQATQLGACDQASQGEWRCTAILEDSHTRTVRCVSWSPDGKCLAMASFDATTSIWSRVGAGWEQVAVLEGHENEVKCVCWSSDGVHIATCGRDKSVWIWESLPGHEYECVDVKQGHTQDVKMVAWHPSGEQLVSCSYDDTIKSWVSDGDEWVCAQTLTGSASGGSGHDSTVWCVSFNIHGTGMVSCSDDKTLKFWTAAPAPGSTGPASVTRPHWRHLCTVSGYHTRTVFSVGWQTCGQQWVATGDGDNSIRIFAPSHDSSHDTSTTPHTITHTHTSTSEGSAKQQPVSSSFQATQATQGAESHVASSWQQLACIESAHEADVNCVRWHPHIPGLLASCGDDGRVKVWSVGSTSV